MSSSGWLAVLCMSLDITQTGCGLKLLVINAHSVVHLYMQVKNITYRLHISDILQPRDEGVTRSLVYGSSLYITYT